MPSPRDIVIIGGGHNGLVTAFYLARAGFKPLLVERRNQVGGAAITEEFHPGFRSSVLAHSAGPLRPEVVRDMRLERHGLKLITPEVAVTALSPDGRALILYRDVERAAQEIAKFSAADAAKYREFQPALEKASRVIGKSLALTPPEVENPTAADLFGLLNLGRSLRGLGKANTYNLLRWAPMAVADLAAEFFENDLLRATIAARGIFGTSLGPWSAGTSLALLLRAAADSNPAGSNFFASGGIGAITQAMATAAQQAGAEIRTGAEVIDIRVKNGVAQGVVLSSGEEILARAVVSNADPKRTFLKLADPSLLAPSFTRRLQNYRMNGTVAKVNLALSGLPTFTALGSTVVKTLAQYAPDLPDKILHHQIITPLDLEETYGLTGGHIFHGELALDQIFTMRPMLDWARYRTPIENLYLCGSGTHPGTGLTGGSGKNAAGEILKDLKARR